jgi:hypothetical protein
MPLTVKQAVEAQGVIEALIQSDKENKYVLSGATRSRLAGSLRKTRPEVEEYRKQHSDLVKRLGEPIEGKEGSFKVKKENIEEFNKENQEMLSAETDIVLSPVDAHQIYGVSKEDYENAESTAKQNQIPIDLYSVLLETNLVKE